MKRLSGLLLLVVILGVAATGRDEPAVEPATGLAAEPAVQRHAASSDAMLAEAFSNQRSDLQVQGRGEVLRILADDTEGSRHQRFIVRLGSGQTLLIAHNIDLAPRVTELRVGDAIEFYGEYEWNDRGGVIHWTHHDPQGRHPAGWLRYRGVTYQ